jgi:hypothetical protein
LLTYLQVILVVDRIYLDAVQARRAHDAARLTPPESRYWSETSYWSFCGEARMTISGSVWDSSLREVCNAVNEIIAIARVMETEKFGPLGDTYRDALLAIRGSASFLVSEIDHTRDLIKQICRNTDRSSISPNIFEELRRKLYSVARTVTDALMLFSDNIINGLKGPINQQYRRDGKNIYYRVMYVRWRTGGAVDAVRREAASSPLPSGLPVDGATGVFSDESKTVAVSWFVANLSGFQNSLEEIIEIVESMRSEKYGPIGESYRKYLDDFYQGCSFSLGNLNETLRNINNINERNTLGKNIVALLKVLDALHEGIYHPVNAIAMLSECIANGYLGPIADQYRTEFKHIFYRGDHVFRLIVSLGDNMRREASTLK